MPKSVLLPAIWNQTVKSPLLEIAPAQTSNDKSTRVVTALLFNGISLRLGSIDFQTHGAVAYRSLVFTIN
jgi:hypothetical protein